MSRMVAWGLGALMRWAHYIVSFLFFGPGLSLYIKKTDSAALSSFGYDARNGILDVCFERRRATYRYLGVPVWTIFGLLRADSMGRYFNFEIRDSYPCIDVTFDPKEWRRGKYNRAQPAFPGPSR